MQHRREIDGLRAVAVLPVIFFHAGFSLFAGGFVGVDIFFVISGYLITSIIVTEQAESRFSLVRFYERRARRILPALFFIMLLTLPVAWLWMPPQQLKDFAQSLVAVPLFASNIFFLTESGYFTPAAVHTPLLHTWSLAVEEQYYVVFPLLLIAVLAAGRRMTLLALALLGVASLGLAQWGSAHAPDASFYLLPTRAWELLSGAALAFVPLAAAPAPRWGFAQWASLAGFALILIAVLTFDSSLPYPGVYTLVPVIGTVLVLRFAQPGTAVRALLASPLLVGIGLISYSAYLWHQPLLSFTWFSHLQDPGPWVMGAVAVASLPLAWLTWRYIEQPFRDRQRVDRRTVFALSATGMVLFIAVGLAGHLRAGMPERFDPHVAGLLAFGHEHREARDGECNVRHADFEPKGCRLGNARATPSVALWGDSFAASLTSELAATLAARNASFVQYSKNGCPSAVGLGTRPKSNCKAYDAKVLEELTHSQIQTVILYSRWQSYVENTPFDNHEGGKEASNNYIYSDVGAMVSEEERVARVGADLRAVVNALLVADKRVILVYPSPEAGWDVPLAMAKKLMDGDLSGSGPTVSRDRFFERNRRTYAAFDAIPPHPHLTRVYPEQALCSAIDGRCATGADAVPFYYDNNHLAEAGARKVVALVADAIDSDKALRLSCAGSCPQGGSRSH